MPTDQPQGRPLQLAKTKRKKLFTCTNQHILKHLASSTVQVKQILYVIPDKSNGTFLLMSQSPAKRI